MATQSSPVKTLHFYVAWLNLVGFSPVSIDIPAVLSGFLTETNSWNRWENILPWNKYFIAPDKYIVKNIMAEIKTCNVGYGFRAAVSTTIHQKSDINKVAVNAMQ